MLRPMRRSDALLYVCLLAHAIEPVSCGNRQRRNARQMARELERAKADAAEEGLAAAAGERIDPLGYYRYKWSAPTDEWCGTELHVDYDGTKAWNWGLDKSQHVENAAQCCAKCRAHAKCNSWVFCPEPVCFAPDAHRHTQGECWLKDQRDPAAPSVNMRGASCDLAPTDLVGSCLRACVPCMRVFSPGDGPVDRHSLPQARTRPNIVRGQVITMRRQWCIGLAGQYGSRAHRPMARGAAGPCGSPCFV